MYALFALFAQVIQSLPVSELCDVFSYGVVSSVLLYHIHLLFGIDDLLGNLKREHFILLL